MRKNSFLNLILVIIFLLSCSNDITEPITLVANAGTNQEVNPLELVTLDGTKSQGPSGFTYEWIYSGDVPESKINFENKNSAQPTFIPPIDGVYAFTVKVASGSDYDEDEVTVVSSGAIELGGTLTEDLQLINIQPDASLPDYIVTRDIIVENGITLSIVENNVRIKFEEGAGIQVQNDGVLTNIDSTGISGYECDLYGDAGWKGILIKGAKISLNNAEIENGGKTAFFGYDEPAVITFTGKSSTLTDLSNNNFVNSQSYDILVLDNPQGSGRVKNNRLSYKIPIKSPITFMKFWHSGEPHIFPAEYDYCHLIPGGKDKIDDISGSFVFHEGGKYYIDGDFWSATSVELSRNTTLYMKANSAIYTEGNFVIHTWIENEVLIEGLNGANWKGIAVASDKEMKINDATIKNAGYGIIKIGSFEAKVQAALYSPNPSIASNIGYIDFSKIINSGGYGYYSESKKKVNFRIRGTLFKNTALPAIRTNTASVGRTIIATNFPNTFELAPGLAAYLVEEDGIPYDPWMGLGDDNFYLIDANILDGSMFSLYSGAILKFKAGRSLIRDITNYNLYFLGTPSKPIILDSELGTPGTWGGIYLGSNYRIENTIIKNGGEFLLPNASEMANIVSAIPAGDNGVYIMQESTISNSAGYGIVIEANTKNFEFENPEFNNTFENNVQGNIIRK